MTNPAYPMPRRPAPPPESVRRAGLIAMNIEDGDRLIAARSAGDDDAAILVGSHGRAIRFRVGTLRVASRASGGVRGMRLPDGAEVIGLVIDCDGEDLLVVSQLGVGKRTAIAEYATKGRGGQGVLTFRITDRSGPLAVARAVRPEQEVILISREGIVMRTRAGSINRQSRGTQGVAVMNIEDGDALAAIAQIDLDAGAPSPSPLDGDPGDDPDGTPADEPDAAIDAPAPEGPEPEDAEPEDPGPDSIEPDQVEPDEVEPTEGSAPDVEGFPDPAVQPTLADPQPSAGSADLPVRRAGEIRDVPPEEIQTAIEAALPAGEWLAHEEVLEALARRLRFAQLWQGIRGTLERALHQSIRDGVIEEDEARRLRRPGP